MSKKKHPGFYFYPADWLCDQKVHACSWAARGLWIEMLCLMTSMDPRGVLIDGLNTMFQSWNIPKRMFPLHLSELKPLLDELEQQGVFSWGGEVEGALPVRAIVNRRMYREWLGAGDLSAKRRAAVQKRWDYARIQNDTKRYKVATNGDTNAIQNESSLTVCGEMSCKENADTNVIQTRYKRDTDPDPTYIDRRSIDLRSAKQASQDPASVGSLVSDLLKVVPTSKPTDWSLHYSRALVDLTNDVAFRKAGYMNRIKRILSWSRGKTELDALLESLAKDTNADLASARGNNQIHNPAKFASAALSRLEREAKA